MNNNEENSNIMIYRVDKILRIVLNEIDGQSMSF